VEGEVLACRAQVAELQKRAASLPDDYLVVLVGDMITEEALPTYMAMLNTLDGVRDQTGAAQTAWGRCGGGRYPAELSSEAAGAVRLCSRASFRVCA
jgi:hypothetical protein